MHKIAINKNFFQSVSLDLIDLIIKINKNKINIGLVGGYTIKMLLVEFIALIKKLKVQKYIHFYLLDERNTNNLNRNDSSLKKILKNSVQYKVFSFNFQKLENNYTYNVHTDLNLISFAKDCHIASIKKEFFNDTIFHSNYYKTISKKIFNDFERCTVTFKYLNKCKNNLVILNDIKRKYCLQKIKKLKVAYIYLNHEIV